MGVKEIFTPGASLDTHCRLGSRKYQTEINFAPLILECSLTFYNKTPLNLIPDLNLRSSNLLEMSLLFFPFLHLDQYLFQIL